MHAVLVVDDDIAIAATLRMILEGEGYRVLVAHNGRDALDVVARERPALVIADVDMPILDGPGLLRAMQADPALRATPAVLMSAAPEPRRGDLVYRRFLAKPFDLDALVALVAELVLGAPAGGQPEAPAQERTVT